MTHKQAQTGGEMGINGEFYEGGQFLPSSVNTVKGAIAKIKKGNREMIAPYVYAGSPADDMLSIYDRINSNVSDNRRECQYIKGQGFTGLTVTPFAVMLCKTEGWAEFIGQLAVKFNAGERWFPLSDDPFHYLNNSK